MIYGNLVSSKADHNRDLLYFQREQRRGGPQLEPTKAPFVVVPALWPLWLAVSVPFLFLFWMVV